MASGSPSTSRQMAATAGPSSSSEKPALTRRARSANSSTAGPSPSPGTSRTHSTPALTRRLDVASSFSPGAAVSSSVTREAAPGRCSRLSSTTSRRRSASQAPSSSMAGRRAARGTARASATVTASRSATPSGSSGSTPARATTAAPSSNLGASRSAAARASRDLPTPPGPTRVSSRHASPSTSAATRSRSSSRPIRPGVWTAAGAPCSRPLRSPSGGPSPRWAGASSPARMRSVSRTVSGDGSTPSSSARTWRAGLELGQGGRPVVLLGQEPHQQPVGLLRQRVERQHAAGQPGHGQPAQVLAFAPGPFLELGGAPHHQVVEEVAPVQPDGRLTRSRSPSPPARAASSSRRSSQ